MTSTSPRPRTGASRPAALSLAALGLIGLSACTAAEEPAEADSGTAERPAEGYVAGEYTATGTYTTPGGEEQIGVTVTLEDDGTLSAVAVEVLGVNPNSKQFQGQFASGIADVAVGENIADLEVDKVAGSSLSSGGFNAALDAIAAEAAQA